MDEPRKYREIAADLQRKIEAGEPPPGERMPSDAELGDIYEVSRNTVREAIKLLLSRGLVEKRSGRGAFVLAQINLFRTVITVDTGFGGFEGAANISKGISSSQRPTVNIPRVGIELPSADIAEELQISESSRVVIRYQERSIDDTLWSTQASYYPMQFVLGGADRLLDVEDISEGVRRYLNSTLRIREIGSHDTMRVRAPNADEAAAFKIPDDGRVAVFETRQTGVDVSHKPIRVTISIYPADRNQFSMETGALADGTRVQMSD
jgi:GntR family transcriptional regulator